MVHTAQCHCVPWVHATCYGVCVIRWLPVLQGANLGWEGGIGYWCVQLPPRSSPSFLETFHILFCPYPSANHHHPNLLLQRKKGKVLQNGNTCVCLLAVRVALPGPQSDFCGIAPGLKLVDREICHCKVLSGLDHRTGSMHKRVCHNEFVRISEDTRIECYASF